MSGRSEAKIALVLQSVACSFVLAGDIWKWQTDRAFNWLDYVLLPVLICGLVMAMRGYMRSRKA